jgi:hypothetical protein
MNFLAHYVFLVLAYLPLHVLIAGDRLCSGLH